MSDSEALVVQEHRFPFLKTLVAACLPLALILFYLSMQQAAPLAHNLLQIGAFAAFALVILGGIQLRRGRYSIKLEPRGSRLHVAFITGSRNVHEDYIPLGVLGKLEIGSTPDTLFPFRLPFQGVDLRFSHNRSGDWHSLFQLEHQVIPVNRSTAESVIRYLHKLQNETPD